MSEDTKNRDELDGQFQDAMRLMEGGDLHGAEEAFQLLITSYGEMGAFDREAMVRINVGQLLQRRGALDDAERQYAGGITAASRADDLRRKGMCLGALATICMERGESQRTEELVLEALALFEELGDLVGMGNQLGNLGLHRQSEGRLEDAIECYSKAANLFVSAGNAHGAVGVLQCVGELHRRQGEYDEAMSAHQRALMVAEATDNRMAQARSTRAVGQILRVQGDLRGALEAIKAGVRLHRESHDVRGELAGLIDLATVEFARGHGTEALKHLNECVQRSQALQMVTPLAKALLNRALYRLDTDRPDEVKQDLAEARKLLELLSDPLAWNVWSVTSARVLIRECQWVEAESILLEELQRAQDHNIASSRPPILGLLAAIDTLRGDVERANQRLIDSEALYRGLGDVEGSRIAVLSRARLLAEMGQLEQAITVLDHLTEATGSASMPQPILQAEILAARAGAKKLAERFEDARTDATQAALLYREAGFQMAELGARLLVRQTHTEAHRINGVPLPDDHMDALRKLVDLAKPLQAPTFEVLTRASLGDALALIGENDEARELTEDALSTARRLGFPDGVGRALEVLARIEDDRTLAIESVRVWLSVGAQVRADRMRRKWKLTDDEVNESP